ncbi:MAG: translation elongation factor Ts, partial [Nitrospirota bacterium]|nr:translation elongation factor Ts [Nitrospirota bacterium]
MSSLSALVKELRGKTGAGILDCQKALQETGSDIEKAIDFLRQKGLATAQKKAGRETKEGLISSYIHAGSKIGVLLEVNCETDFVARNEEFQGFVKEVALQIVASHPLFIKREDIPAELVEREKNIYWAQVKESGKPEGTWERIV